MGLCRMLIDEIKSCGLKASTTSIEHIGEIKEEINSLKEQYLINNRLYEEYLSWFDFNNRGGMQNAKTILVIAYPQFITNVYFEYDKKYTAILPPTYVYNEADSRVESLVCRILNSYGYSMRKAALPAKLLAVRTGLGMYGRNNICYVDGMGSFLRLYIYYTDMPCDEDSWTEKRVMPQCSQCGACVRACPTNCIDEERFLIHAHRCITYFNENEGEFPDWINKGWHNSVVGCIKCQALCPVNKEFICKRQCEAQLEKGEIELILKKTPIEQIPPSLKLKLDNLNLTEYYNVLHRNLSVLL